MRQPSRWIVASYRKCFQSQSECPSCKTENILIKGVHVSSRCVSVSIFPVWVDNSTKTQLYRDIRASIFNATGSKDLQKRVIVDSHIARFGNLDLCCCGTRELTCSFVIFCTTMYFVLHVPPITMVDHPQHVSPSVGRTVSTLFLPVCSSAGVSKLGSSCCPPSPCQAWLSTERPWQGDILSHRVLTHLWPGLVQAFAAQFSGAEASQAIFYCFNPSVSVAWPVLI